jgi:hypothetical protein
MSHATKPARLLVAGRPQRARMPALVILVYAAAVYLFFLAVLGYAAGFFAGFGVPKGIDQGPRAAVPAAVATDLLLLLLFAVQHTVMARPWFKRRWTRIVPGPAERASFVLAASLVLALLFWLWRPVRPDRLDLPAPGAAALLGGVCGRLGDGCQLYLPDQPLRPVRVAAGLVACAAGQVQPSGVRRARRVRAHPAPLMAGFVVIFWSAPVMTAGHLLFAVAATGYILAGIAFEEHDLIQPGRHLRRLPGPRARADPPALAPAPCARVLAKRRERQETGDMKPRTVIVPTAGPAPAKSSAAASAPVVLRDGSAVLIRQVRGTDAPLLADGFARLGAASRQMRFLGVKKELSAAELRYFTDVDHHDHEALGALDRADGHGVGIARYDPRCRRPAGS